MPLKCQKHNDISPRLNHYESESWSASYFHFLLHSACIICQLGSTTYNPASGSHLTPLILCETSTGKSAWCYFYTLKEELPFFRRDSPHEWLSSMY